VVFIVYLNLDGWQRCKSGVALVAHRAPPNPLTMAHDHDALLIWLTYRVVSEEVPSSGNPPACHLSLCI